MGVPLEYKDTIQLVVPILASDGFGGQIVGEIEDVNALFIANTGQTHGNFQTNVISDAEVYLDHENEFVLNNFNRLEGMLVIANPFGEDEDQAWYLITDVITGQDKLLDNQVDNINCQLKKTKPLAYVS